MDYLDFLIAAVGAALGYFLRPRHKVIVNSKSWPSLVSTDSGDTYVRFLYLDGRVRTKKVRASTLDLTVEFDGRVFEAGKWTEDGHEFQEVSS